MKRFGNSFYFVIKGDAKSISIAAASVIAKVTRDRIMLDLDKNILGMVLKIIKIIY